jgi:hypothetical protein
MNNSYLKIFCSLVLLNVSIVCFAQDKDSVDVINTRYDSILHSDLNAMDVLFYKHDKDALINNLGPFGSPSYYPSVLILPSKNLLVQQDLFKMKLYNLGSNNILGG